MGITIFFAAELGKNSLPSILQTCRAFAAEHDWAAESIDEAEIELARLFQKNEPLEIGQALQRNAQQRIADLYLGPTQGIALYPHEDCEPLRIEFDDTGYLQQQVKTQFAGVEVHQQIVELLREISTGFDRFELVDEGRYWESEDPNVLREQFEFSLEAILTLLEDHPDGQIQARRDDGRINDFVDAEGQEINISLGDFGGPGELWREIQTATDSDEAAIQRELALRIKANEVDPILKEQAYLLLRRAASLDDLAAAYHVGVCYRDGEGVESNEGQSLYWFEKAAAQQYPPALYMLGECYRRGWSVPQDIAKAAELFREGAELGDADCEFAWGLCQTLGHGVEAAPEAAIPWFESAVQQDHDAAMDALGIAYRQGQGVELNPAMAAEWFHKAAMMNNANGQFHLAECYRTGFGVELSYADAIHWYEKAAEQGHPAAAANCAGGLAAGEEPTSEQLASLRRALETGEFEVGMHPAQAQFLVGRAFYFGEGVDEDEQRAVMHLQQAAEMGHADASVLLGVAYHHGCGIEIDKRAAEDWFRKAAEMGHAEALHELGLLQTDSGNKEEAAGNFHLAADKGHDDAAKSLADFYRFGEGVEQSDENAIHWYRIAAERGVGAAYVDLGDLYQTGEGVDPDEFEAYHSYQKAVSIDESNANAWARIGDMYYLGIGVAEDANRAAECYTRAIDLAGSEEADWAVTVGRHWELHVNGAVDFKRARHFYQLAAEGEDLTAIFLLAAMTYAGRGVPADVDKAIEIWEEICVDHREAAAWLGMCRQFGIGGEVDLENASSLYELASEHEQDAEGRIRLALLISQQELTDDTRAQIEIYVQFAADLEFPPAIWEATWQKYAKENDNKNNDTVWQKVGDYSLVPPTAEALTRAPGFADAPLSVGWVLSEAERGEAWAINNQGVFYANGYGVPVDFAAARECFRRAAALDLPRAHDNFANFLELGLDGKPDHVAALQHYKIAAEAGLATAAGSVGYFHQYGLAVEVDETEALRWYLRAGEMGDAYSFYRAGVLHEVGHGISRDYAAALKLYRQALGQEEDQLYERAIERAEKLERRNANEFDRFAMQVIDALAAAGEDRKVVYDREHFRILPEGEQTQYVNLENFYHDYRMAESEDQRNSIIARVAHSWSAGSKEIPKSFEDVNPDLLPAIRPLSYFEFIDLNMQLEGNAARTRWPHRVVGEHLGLGLVYDMQETMHFVNESHLEEWGVTSYEAMEAAIENLADMTEAEFVSPMPGVHIANCRDSYDASRMVLIELITQLEVNGDPVVMAPNRETLIVTGSDDEDGLTALLSIAEDSFSRGRLISELAFRLKAGEWVPWIPDSMHPLFHQFKRLEVRYFDRSYGEQAELLRAIYAQEGKPDHLVDFEFTDRKEDASLTSFCRWEAGAAALLPQVDFVCLQDEDTVIGVYKFGDVRKELESLADGAWKTMETYPPRFRATKFPSTDLIKTWKQADDTPHIPPPNVSRFATGEYDDDGAPIYATGRCRLFGHPEFYIPFTGHGEELDFLERFLHIGENMAAQGASFQAGQTLQYTWAILRVEKYDAGRLTLCEPDMKSWPCEYQRGISQTLKQARDQALAADSVDVPRNELEAPHMRQFAEVHGDAKLAESWRLERHNPNDEDDSGWRFIALPPSENDSIEFISLYELFLAKPAIVSLLALPYDTTAHFEQNRLQAVTLHGEPAEIQPNSLLSDL